MTIRKITSLSVLLALVSLIPVGLRAIPNQFGANTFINPAGMRLEDFAAQPDIWKQNQELKGTWEMWSDESVTDSTVEVLHLTMPAIVFGVQASEVTVQRRDQQILKFKVVFKPNKQIDDFRKLKRVIKTNASVWSGGDSDSDTMKEGSAVYTFKENSDTNQLVVTIKSV